ncbi:protein tailless-like [Penaeus monodon]|uniref:protein tailless-like n=1 Tax=Penaeus monodon TaxID=6687 RepID=UPI0018A6D8A7|nr:protein tailless-like [Penaeus monodon]
MFAPDLPGGGAFPPVSVGGGTGLPPLPPYYPALLPPMPFKPPFLPMTPSMAPLTLHLSHNSAFKPNMAILGGDLRRPLADAGLRRSPSPPDFKPPAADRLDAKFPPRDRSPDFKAAVDERAAAKQPIMERLELKPPPPELRQPMGDVMEAPRPANEGSAFSPPRRGAATPPSGGRDGETRSPDAAHRLEPSVPASLSRAPPISVDPGSLVITPTDSVYENAAKLLFLGVKWARSIPSFMQLPFRDQAILLEESWSELFVVAAAQWSLPLDEGSLVRASGASPEQQAALGREVVAMRDIITRLHALRVDHTEYACLKALILFRPGEPGGGGGGYLASKVCGAEDCRQHAHREGSLRYVQVQLRIGYFALPAAEGGGFLAPAVGREAAWNQLRGCDLVPAGGKGDVRNQLRWAVNSRHQLLKARLIGTS